MGQQPLPQAVHVPLITPGNHRDITLALFQQFQQPVFDGDLSMGAGLTQGSGTGQCLRTIRI
ncbi:Uncharacterised protein [Yersinia pseudotuberculosis]|nr:Uncharacterised protein [Yersinia pseudotuberculosis]